jgi:hypothetical protein
MAKRMSKLDVAIVVAIILATNVSAAVLGFLHWVWVVLEVVPILFGCVIYLLDDEP